MLSTLETVRDSVINTIAANDNMNMSTSERYFHVGEDALSVIHKCLLLAGIPDPRRILDFGCGWGRVTRFLRAGFPAAEITGCDIVPAAVEFNRHTFDTLPLQSAHNIDELKLPGDYDLIWSGSVITHITEENCRSLLRHFETALAPNGLMVFTTHGRYVHWRRKHGEYAYNITDEDFEQADQCWQRGEYGRVGYEGNEVYGFALQPPAWFFRFLDESPELRIVAYIERGWDDHQDVVAIQKKPIYMKHSP